MTDKRSLIVTTAKQLFTEQGIRGTTISAIAEQAGIAKGSVYSYFESKLAIIKAILHEADETYRSQVDDLLKADTPQGNGLLLSHIKLQLEGALEERTFQQALLSDDSWVMDQDILNFVKNSRVEYARMQKTILLRVFGDGISPWVLDMVTMLNGMLNEYSAYLVIDYAEFSSERCAEFISYTMALVAKDVTQSQPLPVLSEEEFALGETAQAEMMKARAEEILLKMRRALADMDDRHRELAAETLEMLEQQIQEETINFTLTRALIANLRPYDVFNHFRSDLAEVFDVELI